MCPPPFAFWESSHVSGTAPQQYLDCIEHDTDICRVCGARYVCVDLSLSTPVFHEELFHNVVQRSLVIVSTCVLSILDEIWIITWRVEDV